MITNKHQLVFQSIEFLYNTIIQCTLVMNRSRFCNDLVTATEMISDRKTDITTYSHLNIDQAKSRHLR